MRIGGQHYRSVVQRLRRLYRVLPKQRTESGAHIVRINEQIVEFNRCGVQRDEAVEPNIVPVGFQNKYQEIRGEFDGLKVICAHPASTVKSIE